MRTYKLSNRPVATFSITSSPIIYREKVLTYVTILASKLVAFHRALTDLKKPQKLHFYNKNFKNDFSFPNVFVCNIATTPPSSSYHLIQLFKYYKTMPFSKVRNTGHYVNHKEKHSKRPMLYIGESMGSHQSIRQPPLNSMKLSEFVELFSVIILIPIFKNFNTSFV